MLCKAACSALFQMTKCEHIYVGAKDLFIIYENIIVTCNVGCNYNNKQQATFIKADNRKLSNLSVNWQAMMVFKIVSFI